MHPRSALTFLSLTAAIGFASADVGRGVEPDPTALRSAVLKAAQELPAGGLVVAEIDGGKAIYSTAGGIPRLDGVPPERLIFEIGSITKVFTGLLLAQASLEGKVSLDDPIGAHLPADLKLSPRLAAVTLQQLASHTSGLPRLPVNFLPANPADPYSDYTEERLYAFLRWHEPAMDAPQPAAYSNLGAGLLGHLLARAYGMSFAELVRTKITGPVGMSDTVVELSSEQKTRFVAPHSGTVEVSPWSLGALGGAGALRSTAADMTKFVQALQDEQSPLAAAWRVASAPRAAHGGGQIGLGVMMHVRAGETVYNHGGGTGGFRSYFEIVPATRRSTVLWLNNDTTEPAAIVASIHRPARTASAAQTVAEESLSVDELKAYAGVYEIDASGRFTVVLDEQSRLRIRLTGQSFLPITSLGADRFAAQAVAAEFQFERDESGVVTAMTLHQGGNVLPARRTGEAPATIFPSEEKLREYVGLYELMPGLLFEVSARRQTLLVKITGQPALPVHCTRPDHFVYDVVDAAVTFERDESGAVRTLVLHQHGIDQRATRRPAN